MQKTFHHAAALLDFLEADEPERYVFRGQTRTYEGPMLASGSRDRFIRFDPPTSSSEWAGVTESQSLIQDKVNARRREVFTEVWTGKDIDDQKTTWDLPESAYQQGFRDFYNRSRSYRMERLGNVLRESAIPAIYALLGNDLAALLCQRYGFTSTALDVTIDPSVAIFFATHEAPFFSFVADSSRLGVIYRWPKKRAMIAQDLLLPLESLNFDSITTSFRNFIRDSVDLTVVKDTLVRYKSTTGKHQKRLMSIVAEGERRSLDALRFPPGAFDRSRMGRQRAALLWPKFEVVKALRPRHDRDFAALIGDLLKTHGGEVFRFRHGGATLSERLNKFELWPSIRLTDQEQAKRVTSSRQSRFSAQIKDLIRRTEMVFRRSPATNSGLELRQEIIQFEDPYLEMMQRFFSSCGPCDIIMGELLEPGNRTTLRGIGVVHGVVDLGYLLDASDAPWIAKRLRNPAIYTPIPTLRYIPAEHVASFQAAFAEAKAS